MLSNNLELNTFVRECSHHPMNFHVVGHSNDSFTHVTIQDILSSINVIDLTGKLNYHALSMTNVDSFYASWGIYQIGL